MRPNNCFKTERFLNDVFKKNLKSVPAKTTKGVKCEEKSGEDYKMELFEH